MSLNFDLSAVKNYETVTTHPNDLNEEKQRWHPVTDALIWKMLAIDINSIKEDNVDEVWFRIRLLQILDGPEFRWGGHSGVEQSEASLTKQDVIDHIGLSTNVSTKSRKDWLVKVFQVKSSRFNETLNGGQSAHQVIDAFYAAHPSPHPDKEKGGAAS